MRPMGQRTPVLIVGAGPTGMTLACDLARRGIACRVVDKPVEPFPGSRGKGLQPRTLEVFDDLGVIVRCLPPVRRSRPFGCMSARRFVGSGPSKRCSVRLVGPRPAHLIRGPG